MRELLENLLGRADAEWLLLSLWVGLLGIQFGVNETLRIAPSDVVLALLMFLIAVRDRDALVRVVRSRVPLNIALLLVAVALIWGTAVAFVRTGSVAREALLNKDLGVVVLASVTVAIRCVVRSPSDLRNILRTFVIAAATTTALALLDETVVPLVRGTAPPTRFEGFLLNPSANAIFLGVALLGLIGLDRGNATRHRKMLSVGGALFFACTIVLTLSRSSWIAIIVSLAALIALRRTRVALPAISLVILLLFVVQPLAASLMPLVGQLESGRLGAFERDIAPHATPSLDAQAALEAASATPRATVPPAPSAAVAPTSSGTVTQQFVSTASIVATDQYGATDRVALDILAVRLWVSQPSTFVTGLGLEVFLAVSAAYAGAPLIIHNTYAWLPAEMGIPGVAALLSVLYAMWWVARGAWRAGETSVGPAVTGAVILFAVWIGVNEGLYQRTLWMTLALGTAAIGIATKATWVIPAVDRRPRVATAPT